MHLPIILKTETLFEESFVKLEKDLLQINAHPPYPYYSLRTHPFAVAILATTPSGEFLLIEEYRHPTKQILLSCPCGYIDANENPTEAACRELLEETGYQAKSFAIMGRAFPYSGFSGQKTIYISASEATCTAAQKLERSEVISPLLLMPEDLTKKIKEGVQVDGTLCTALYFHSMTKEQI
jgi:ADP-ribose pyrophosphatase